ncbi:MAG: nucleotide-binding protein [Methanoregulaceae archaeon]|nr:nucleotide-binding protein [Methanoregulaceae archaeon]
MKIGTVNVRISIVAVAVVVFFAIFLSFAYLTTGDPNILLWGIPCLVLLLVIPIGLNYMSQSQYQAIEPVYQAEAKNVRIRMINDSLLNKPVRIEGVVERSYFQFLNRPQFLVADRTGEISVKMFTTPKEEIRKGDVVEVVGMVIKRYVITGDPVINCVSIRKISKKIEAMKDTSKD